MHDLPWRPATVAVRRVELRLGEAVDRGRQRGRRHGNLINHAGALGRINRGLAAPLANGITKIIRNGHDPALYRSGQVSAYVHSLRFTCEPPTSDLRPP